MLPTTAAKLNILPSKRDSVPNLASQMRVASSRIVRNTNSRSPGDFEMRRKTSEVAASRSRASSRSRRSRPTSVSWPEADELLWRTVFGAFALRFRPLDSLLLALERRRIAHPKGLGPRRFSKWDYSRDLRPAKWGSVIKLHSSNSEPPMSALSALNKQVQELALSNHHISAL